MINCIKLLDVCYACVVIYTHYATHTCPQIQLVTILIIAGTVHILRLKCFPKTYAMLWLLILMGKEKN